MKTTHQMGPTEWALLLLLASLWGSSFLFMKVAVQELPVLTVALGRIGLAALAMLLYIRLTGQRLPSDGKSWRQLMLLGFLRAGLPITLFVWAGTRIDSNLSGILNSTTPLFTALVAHFFTQDERLTRWRLLGIISGMIGVIFLIGPSALQGLGGNVLGQLAVLVATCSYGFAAVYGRRFKEMPVAVSTAGLLCTATVMILPLALWIDQPWQLRPTALAPVAAVVALALFNTAIAFVVWLTLVLRAGANNSSQVTFIIPLFALLLGYLVLGERPGWNALAGLVFILGGLFLAQGWLSTPRLANPTGSPTRRVG